MTKTSIARADDSHDGRYTHPTMKGAPDALSTDFPRMLYGRPYVNGQGVTVQDKVFVHSAVDEDDKVKSGSWFTTPNGWRAEEARAPGAKAAEAGFARLGAFFVAAAAAVVAAVLITLGTMPSMTAQTPLTLTTLAAAFPAPTQGNQQQQITVASATNVAIGQGIYVDLEYMRVVGSTPNTTIWTVSRGQQGTGARSHNLGATVFVGSPTYFADQHQVGGSCTSTKAIALPHIDVTSGQISNCPAVNTLAGSAPSTWDVWFLGGNPISSPARYTGWTYVTQGALTIQSGVSFLGSSGALGMTLVSPTIAMNGLLMTIQASTAQAHTVTYTPGFNGGSTSTDVATFGGAVGDQMTIYANNGVWWTLLLRNVTLG